MDHLTPFERRQLAAKNREYFSNSERIAKEVAGGNKNPQQPKTKTKTDKKLS
jgi:hypothetical protein